MATPIPQRLREAGEIIVSGGRPPSAQDGYDGEDANRALLSPERSGRMGR